MDDEAKAPNDIEWQFVDIYLFCNGQQQTPPRKYHMNLDDLNNWNITLKTFARSLFGNIFDTIDLYTMDGVKVLTPMQLSHDTAYVAVPPQDTFIHAGYNDYMLKASRSREKRKSRNLSIIDHMKTKLEETVLKENEEKNVRNSDEEIEINTTNADTPASPPSSHITQPQPQNALKNNIIATQQSERRSSNNKTSTLKKNSTLLPQSIAKRPPLKSKEVIPKKNLKLNTSNLTTPSAIVRNGNSNLIVSKPKIITKTNKSSPRETVCSIPVNLSIINENIPSPNKNSTLEKNIYTEGTMMESIIDDRELIVVKNPDSEMTAVFLGRDKSASINNRHAKLSLMVPVIRPSGENRTTEPNEDDLPAAVINNNGVNVCKPDVAISDIKIKNCCDISLPENADLNDKTIASHKLTTDNFVNCDRRDVINLNLKIELGKGSPGVIEHYDSYSNKLNCIPGKSAQANEDEIFIDCTTKHSRLTDSPATNVENPKIFIVHCACCDHCNLTDTVHKIDETSKNLEEKNYVILLPSPRQDKKIERTQDVQEYELNGEESTRCSVENPLRKAFVSTSLHMSQCTDDGVVITSKSEIHATEEDKKPDNIVTKVDQKILNDERDSKQVFITGNKIESNKEMMSTEPQTTRKSINNSNVSPLTTDNNTQTDWHTMLLEARLHEDGHYTFHLPPLEVLKYYGFG